VLTASQRKVCAPPPCGIQLSHGVAPYTIERTDSMFAVSATSTPSLALLQRVGSGSRARGSLRRSSVVVVRATSKGGGGGAEGEEGEEGDDHACVAASISSVMSYW